MLKSKLRGSGPKLRQEKIAEAVRRHGQVSVEQLALRDPERTPSAALLAALRTEQASFFEYTLDLARSHAAYFRDFPLGAAREQALVETARQSLEDAETLAVKDSRPFTDYLRDYFAQT